MRGGLSGIEPDYTIGLEVTSSAPWLHRCCPLRSPCSRKQVFLQDAAFDEICYAFDAAFDVLADGGSMPAVFVSISWSSWPCSRVARYLYLASQKSHDPSPHHTHTSQLLLTVGMCRPSLTIGMCRPSLMRVIKPQGGWGAR